MNHFSYPLTIAQISIFEEPRNIFSNQNLRPQTIEPAPPRIFNCRVPPWMVLLMLIVKCHNNLSPFLVRHEDRLLTHKTTSKVLIALRSGLRSLPTCTDYVNLIDHASVNNFNISRHITPRNILTNATFWKQ